MGFVFLAMHVCGWLNGEVCVWLIITFSCYLNIFVVMQPFYSMDVLNN